MFAADVDAGAPGRAEREHAGGRGHGNQQRGRDGPGGGAGHEHGYTRHHISGRTYARPARAQAEARRGPIRRHAAKQVAQNAEQERQPGKDTQ